MTKWTGQVARHLIREHPDWPLCRGDSGTSRATPSQCYPRVIFGPVESFFEPCGRYVSLNLDKTLMNRPLIEVRRALRGAPHTLFENQGSKSSGLALRSGNDFSDSCLCGDSGKSQLVFLFYFQTLSRLLGVSMPGRFQWLLDRSETLAASLSPDFAFYPICF